MDNYVDPSLLLLPEKINKPIHKLLVMCKNFRVHLLSLKIHIQTHTHTYIYMAI